MSKRFVLLVALFALALVQAATDEASHTEEEDVYEYADDEIEERAFLIVQKTAGKKEVSEGTNVTVTLTLHNAGTRAAANIEIKDSELPEGVTVLEKESVPATIEKLEAGTSMAYKTVLRLAVPGNTVLTPTIVTYSPAVGSIERQIGYSTVTAVSVLTTQNYLLSKVLLMGSYATFGAVQSLEQWIRFGMAMVAISVAMAVSYLWQKLTEARRERMRRRATEFIEKSE